MYNRGCRSCLRWWVTCHFEWKIITCWRGSHVAEVSNNITTIDENKILKLALDFNSYSKREECLPSCFLRELKIYNPKSGTSICKRFTWTKMCKCATWLGKMKLFTIWYARPRTRNLFLSIITPRKISSLTL